MKSVDLSDAKARLGSLVEEAAAGENIVISKAGTPLAMLVALPEKKSLRTPAGALRVTFVAPDFDAFDPEIAVLFDSETRPGADGPVSGAAVRNLTKSSD